MATIATAPLQTHASHPVRVRVEHLLAPRDRLTVAFRLILAIPHLILVGGPISGAVWWFWGTPNGRADWSASGGLLGAVAVICAMIAWFAILFTGRQPQGLWDLAAYYLRWRVRAMAYLALLRDEYPPFGDGPYPAALDVAPPEQPRHKLTVAFRLILIVPHVVVLWFLGLGWAVATIIAWFAILLDGRYPEALYRFSVGVLRWNIRVEAYALLLRDEYPPFTLNDA